MIIDYKEKEFVEWDYNDLSTVEHLMGEIYNSGYALSAYHPHYIEFWNDDTFEEIVFYTPFNYTSDNEDLNSHVEKVAKKFQEQFNNRIKEYGARNHE